MNSLVGLQPLLQLLFAHKRDCWSSNVGIDSLNFRVKEGFSSLFKEHCYRKFTLTYVGCHLPHLGPIMTQKEEGG